MHVIRVYRTMHQLQLETTHTSLAGKADDEEMTFDEVAVVSALDVARFEYISRHPVVGQRAQRPIADRIITLRKQHHFPLPNFRIYKTTCCRHNCYKYE